MAGSKRIQGRIHLKGTTVESRLQQAFDLLDNGKAWSQGRYARDKNEKATFVRGDDAVSFCSVGALARVWDCEIVAQNGGFAKDFTRLAKAAKAKGFNSASSLNDDPKTTFELIVDLFAAAIEQS
jgi:hypothetical protein